MRLSMLMVAAVFACGPTSEPPPTTTSLSEGAVEPLPSDSSWRTLTSFTGKAITGHLWGAVTDGDYEFHAGAGDFVRGADGFEFLALGANGAGGTTQNHVIRFSADTSGKPRKAQWYTTLIDSYYPHGMRLLSGGVWVWHGDTYANSVEVRHTLMEKPYLDVSPFYQKGQRLRLSKVGGVRSFIDQAEAPWFSGSNRAFTPPLPNQVYSDVADVNAYVCDRCLEFNRRELLDAFVLQRTLYWAAFGQQSGSLAPHRLVVFTPQATPAGKEHETTGYLEDLFATYSDPPIDFDDVVWFRAHVSNGLAYLTWLGTTTASQLVFNPADKSFQVRMNAVPLTGLTLTDVITHAFDARGDVYFLQGHRELARVWKLTPTGLKDVAGAIQPLQTPVPGATKYVRAIEGLYVDGDRPVVVVVGNGRPHIEPQLSLITPKEP